MNIFFLFLMIINSHALASSIKFNSEVEDLYKTFKKERIKNILSAIDLFDDNFFRENQYAIIFNSQSIQPSSYKYPRILLFGKNNYLRVGINHYLGEEKKLEVLQFRPKNKVWELREIGFKNGNVWISKANPPKCLSCHGDKEIMPGFKGRELQASEYALNFLKTGKKPDINNFKKLIKSDPIYSRLENIQGYLRNLGL